MKNRYKKYWRWRIKAIKRALRAQAIPVLTGEWTFLKPGLTIGHDVSQKETASKLSEVRFLTHLYNFKWAT